MNDLRLYSNLSTEVCQAPGPGPGEAVDSPSFESRSHPGAFSCGFSSPSSCAVWRRYGKAKRYAGELCGCCPWLLIYPFVAESRTKRVVWKRNRAYVRIAKGMGIEWLAGNRLVTFTVGESYESQSQGLVFGDSVDQFRVEFRRKYGQELSYCWVEHKPLAGKSYRDGKGLSRVSEGHYNRHFVVSGSGRIDVVWLDRVCLRLFACHESGLSEVKNNRGYGFYLASYVSKDDEEFVRVRFSQNWVFRGWVTLDRASRLEYGAYLPAERLVEFKRDLGSRRDFIDGLLLNGRFVCAGGLRRDLELIRRKLKQGGDYE